MKKKLLLNIHIPWALNSIIMDDSKFIIILKINLVQNIIFIILYLYKQYKFKCHFSFYFIYDPKNNFIKNTFLYFFYLNYLFLLIQPTIYIFHCLLHRLFNLETPFNQLLSSIIFLLKLTNFQKIF